MHRSKWLPWVTGAILITLFNRIITSPDFLACFVTNVGEICGDVLFTVVLSVGMAGISSLLLRKFSKYTRADSIALALIFLVTGGLQFVLMRSDDLRVFFFYLLPHQATFSIYGHSIEGIMTQGFWGCFFVLIGLLEMTRLLRLQPMSRRDNRK